MKCAARILGGLVAVVLAVAPAATPALTAALPPSAIHYQGVLRDASDNPRNGSFDMVFRFFNAPVAGDEILVDQHLAAGAGAVSVTGGLFGVELGSGTVSDGSGPGSYLNLAGVFGDYQTVFLQIEIKSGASFETLSPRVQVASAAYAQNASRLAGLSKSDFAQVHTTVVNFDGAIEAPRFDAVDSADPAHAVTILPNVVLVQQLMGFDANIAELTGGQLYLEIKDNTTPIRVIDSSTTTHPNFLQTWQRSEPTFAVASVASDGKISTTGGFEGNGSLVTNVDAASIGGKLAAALLDTSATAQIKTGDLTVKNLTVSGGSIDQGGVGSIGIHAPLNVLVEADSSVRTMIDKDNNVSNQLAVWFHDGVYANSKELMELSELGNLRIHGALAQNDPFPLAEAFFKAEPVEPGDLVAVVAGKPNAVRKTAVAGDRAVLGVVITQPGVLLGGAPFDTPSLERAWGLEIASLFEEKRGDLEAAIRLDRPSLAQEADGAERVEGLALEKFHELYFAPIALAGRVPVKVDASFGAIEVGDLLAPSTIPGVAMKATKSGPTVGKALEPLGAGQGRILALVNTGWLGAEAPVEASAKVEPAVPVAPSMREPLERFVPAETRDITAVETVPFSFPVSILEPVESGEVLAVDADHPGQFAQARRAADPTVVGIAAGGSHDIWRGRAPLALPGTIVRCNVDASGGAILAGDLLVASPVPGYAMASMNPKPGTVIAKALEPLQSGRGSILVLVQPR